MIRCEHEIINKINSINVTDILLLFHPIQQNLQEVKEDH